MKLRKFVFLCVDSRLAGYDTGNFDPAIAARIDKLHADLVAKGYQVCYYMSPLYSYQGGDISKPLLTTERPEEWAGRHNVFERPLGSPGEEWAAYEGDTLLCVATKDRYSYVPARKLDYHECKTLEEAEAFVAALEPAD